MDSLKFQCTLHYKAQFHKEAIPSPLEKSLCYEERGRGKLLPSSQHHNLNVKWSLVHVTCTQQTLRGHLSSAFQSNQTTFKAEDDQLLPKQPNSISCCQLYSQVIGKYARTYRSRMQTVPEDNISDSEGVLIDASGWHPHTQHVLCCRDKVLSTNSLQVIKVTVAGYQIYQVRKSHYTVARNQYLFL